MFWPNFWEFPTNKRQRGFSYIEYMQVIDWSFKEIFWIYFFIFACILNRHIYRVIEFCIGRVMLITTNKSTVWKTLWNIFCCDETSKIKPKYHSLITQNLAMKLKWLSLSVPNEQVNRLTGGKGWCYIDIITSLLSSFFLSPKYVLCFGDVLFW